jgi:ketosteroid isomerase-like protein
LRGTGLRRSTIENLIDGGLTTAMHLLFLVFFLTIQAQPDPAREIIDLERQLTDALVRLDVVTTEKLWSDDLVFVAPDGKVTSKVQRLTGMKAQIGVTGPAVSSAANDDVKVRIYGETAVVTLLATWRGTANNREFSDTYMTTHVWSKHGGRWLLVSAHVSRVAP